MLRLLYRNKSALLWLLELRLLELQRNDTTLRSRRGLQARVGRSMLTGMMWCVASLVRV